MEATLQRWRLEKAPVIAILQAYCTMGLPIISPKFMVITSFGKRNVAEMSLKEESEQFLDQQDCCLVRFCLVISDTMVDAQTS